MEGYHYRERTDEAENELEQEAASTLRRMVDARPALAQYVQQTAVDNASSAMGSLRRMLSGGRPGFFDELKRRLEEAAKRKPGKTIMAIFPDFPLVFQAIDHRLIGFAPALACTLNAIDDLPQAGKNPQIISSDNGLVPYVLNLSSKDPIVAYQNGMKPQDYIALAASSFKNETFRFRIRGNKLVRH